MFTFHVCVEGVSFVWVPGSSAVVVCHPLSMIRTILVSDLSLMVYYDAIRSILVLRT